MQQGIKTRRVFGDPSGFSTSIASAAAFALPRVPAASGRWRRICWRSWRRSDVRREPQTRRILETRRVCSIVMLREHRKELFRIEFAVLSSVHGLNRLSDRARFQTQPRSRKQNQDSQFSPPQILLMLEILIGRHQKLVARLFGGVKQFAVSQPIPIRTRCQLNALRGMRGEAPAFPGQIGFSLRDWHR